MFDELARQSIRNHLYMVEHSIPEQAIQEIMERQRAEREADGRELASDEEAPDGDGA
jgi:hypothetical protein